MPFIFEKASLASAIILKSISDTSWQSWMFLRLYANKVSRLLDALGLCMLYPSFSVFFLGEMC